MPGGAESAPPDLLEDEGGAADAAPAPVRAGLSGTRSDENGWLCPPFWHRCRCGSVLTCGNAFSRVLDAENPNLQA